MSLTFRRLILTAGLVSVCGCAGGSSGVRPGGAHGPELPPSPYVVKHCGLDVVLEPAAHRLEATATLTLAFKDKAVRKVPGKLYLELHNDLGIDSVVSAGSPVTFRRLSDAERPAKADEACPESEDAGPPPAIYQLEWTRVGDQPGTLVVRYGGRVFQDVEAGEKIGEIHNFQVRAHVGEDGIYLGEGGAWYPRLYEPDEDEPTQEYPLTQFELTVTEPPGMVLVACGNRDGAKINTPRGERTTWRSPFPFQGMVITGGPHQVFQRQVDKVLVSVHLAEDHVSLAPVFLDAFESYLRLYQPLIGQYPYVEFTFVENFFSSGFAFPGFTLLGPRAVGMGSNALVPGYMDHEMLHNWWGNGVFVSALDGNWCECLTSYCANYMRHVLEGRHEKARAQRRNICYGLSRVTAERDKPLGDYGRDEDVSRFIGYQKGSMVFAMLAQQIGTDAVWRAFRRLYEERLGKPTNWEDIRRTLEQESGQPLDAFFERWVRGSGVPDIVIDEARYDQRARRLTITVLQKGDDIFNIALPIRLVYDDGITEETIVVNRPAQVAVIKTLVPPRFVELDPDFRIMRSVPLGDLMPTISGIGKSKNLLIVRSEEDADAYATVADALKKRYKKAEDTSVREAEVSELTTQDLEDGHALLLGKACLAPAVGEILKGAPVAFGDGFFSVGDNRYDKPTNEILCCVRNGLDAGGVICCYYGNSAADLKKARVVTFYGGNSLVVFEDGKVVERRDFERTHRVPVKNGG